MFTVGVQRFEYPEFFGGVGKEILNVKLIVLLFFYLIGFFLKVQLREKQYVDFFKIKIYLPRNIGLMKIFGDPFQVQG